MTTTQGSICTCGVDLFGRISSINWAEVMAVECQIPEPDELPVTLDLDSEIFCPMCEREYLVKAKVRVTVDGGEIITVSLTPQ